MFFHTAILALLCVGALNAVPVDGPGKINDLQTLDPYQPEKAPNIPVLLGERRKKLQSHDSYHSFKKSNVSGCDNIYHGAIMPCLLRPQLPPYSYSTETYYNMEYKKKK